MCDRLIIVLKFGGSVLRSEETLRIAAQEIIRWRREGRQVLAVVSALAGRTDELLASSRRICDAATPESVAALVSVGELHSAALLALHLDHARVSNCVLTPAAVRLVATGDALDADPVGLDEAAVRDALERHGAAIVPGYAAVDRAGRTVVLGRGGSDLSALFLAHRLGAGCCRLIKDVDGLYDRDPALPGPAPRRYSAATWGDALALDGSIVQHKAVRFARAHDLEFELGSLHGAAPTHVGRGPTSLVSELAA